ncbi:hypothetical protein DERF_012050 [Dermatophagoides farinae]|uniref:Uncharacterized protein n=1 Tax=Dermatophagoides farinae TaxID=6954 RepID=A0A922HP93_DERFA|nr:hypothetical protein DERF_012050 [Dermatophagoides farinae]
MGYEKKILLKFNYKFYYSIREFIFKNFENKTKKKEKNILAKNQNHAIITKKPSASLRSNCSISNQNDDTASVKEKKK